MRVLIKSLVGILFAVAPVTVAWAADEIHWSFTSQTSVTVDWRGPENTIRYGLTPSYGQTVTAATPSIVPFSSSGPFWEAKITGLKENSLYHYSVGSGPDHTFKTPLPRGSSGFTFFGQGCTGDAGTYPNVGHIQSLIAADRPDFVIFYGDLTYGNAHGQAVVDRHFNDMMVWSQDAAYMPAWGNHEWDKPTDDLRNYKGRFDLPNPQTSPGSPSVSCCGEDWYWFDYGNVRFIAYPEPWSGAWADWKTKAGALMDEAQADPAIRFIVTFGHRPAYSSGHHPGSSTLQEILDGFGDAHSKYVLNMNAHSHSYERSLPQHGVVHVTACGGAVLEDDPVGTCLWKGGCPPPSWSAYRAMHHATARLRVEANSIALETICGPPDEKVASEYDVRCTQGTIIDSYTIGSEVADSVPPSPPANLRLR